MTIEFEEKTPSVIKAWEKRSKDGKWEMDFKESANGKHQYWLYYYPLGFGKHSDTEEDALKEFAKALQEHIEECKALVAQIESENSETEEKETK